MLKGKRVVLRSLERRDLDFICHIENNKKNWIFGSEEKHFTKKELESYIGNAKMNIEVAKQYRFVIDINTTPIGFIDLYNYTNQSVSTGIIIEEKYRRKGYAKEAMQILEDYVFSTLNIGCITCVVNKNNYASKTFFINCDFIINTQEKELLYFSKLSSPKV